MDAVGFSSHPAIRRQWHVVACSSDLAAGSADGVGTPVGVHVCGERLVLYRDADGAVVAAPDRCPHREAPLSLGALTVNGELECAYHGWRFGTDGRCTAVPSSSGEGGPVPPAAHLPTVRCAERYGLVWVALDEPDAPIPAIAQDDDPGFRRIQNPVEQWRTCALRMTDNFCDTAHFPFVHTGTFGIAQATEVAPVALEPLDDDWYGYRYAVDVRNDPAAHATTGQDAPVLHREMTTGFHLPFLVRSTIRYETGLQHVLLLCTTPIDDLTSLFTFVVWRNDDRGVPEEEVVAFDRAIGAEDRSMLERVPGVLPLDLGATVSVQADRCSVEWRRRLVGMLLAG